MQYPASASCKKYSEMDFWNWFTFDILGHKMVVKSAVVKTKLVES